MPFHVPRRAGNHPRIVALALGLIVAVGGGLIALSHFDRPSAADRIEASAARAGPRPPLVPVRDLPVFAAIRDADPRFMGGILVARGDEVLFRQVYGMADREAGEPLALDSRFRLASVSKQFTAAAILRLQDQGMLDVRDPLCEWIQPCPDAWAPIRLHHLLSHTAGVPDLMAQANWGVIRRTPRTVKELTATTAQYRLQFEPGTKIRYSNAGYNLLGVVVERASGMAYEDFLRTQFFEPLGMNDTGSDADGSGHGVVMGYATFPGGIAPQPNANVSVVFASGALYSTLDDMLVWQRALHGGRVLAPYSYAQMVTDHSPPDTPDIRGRPHRWWGYGLFVDDLSLRVVPPFSARQVYHTGSWGGFRNMVTHQPEGDVTVVVLGNNYHQRDEVFLIAQQAMAEALGKQVPTALER